MSRTLLRSVSMAALAAGCVYGQLGTVTCTPSTLPQVVGVIVSVSCSLSLAVPPVTWSISPGKLPPGLSLDPQKGNITGTLADPAGPYSFTLNAVDSLSLSGSLPFTGTTVDPLTVNCASSAGPVQVGVPYTNSCTAGGGTSPYSWAIVGQSPPRPHHLCGGRH